MWMLTIADNYSVQILAQRNPLRTLSPMISVFINMAISIAISVC
jgi:hypothetical protein